MKLEGNSDGHCDSMCPLVVPYEKFGNLECIVTRHTLCTHTNTHTHTHTTHLAYTTAELLRIPHTCCVRVSGMFSYQFPFSGNINEHTYKQTMNIIKSGPVLPVSIKTACSIVVTTEYHRVAQRNLDY